MFWFFNRQDFKKLTKFEKGDHRSNWSSDQKNLWIDGTKYLMKNLSLKPGDGICKVALRFCFYFYKPVVLALTGALYKSETDVHADAACEGPLSDEND